MSQKAPRALFDLTRDLQSLSGHRKALRERLQRDLDTISHDMSFRDDPFYKLLLDELHRDLVCRINKEATDTEDQYHIKLSFLDRTHADFILETHYTLLSIVRRAEGYGIDLNDASDSIMTFEQNVADSIEADMNMGDAVKSVTFNDDFEDLVVVVNFPHE